MISKKNNNKNLTKNTNIKKIEFIIEKYGFLIFLFLSILSAFIIFKDFFLCDLLFYFKDIGSDSVNITLPNYYQSEYLNETEGWNKTWTFYSGMGEKLPNALSLNPISFLKRIIFSIFGIKMWYFRIYLVYFLNFLPIGIISFFYFRTLKYSKFTAIIGALLFQFSGYLIVGSQWGHAYRILYSIFFIFAFEQFLIKKRWFFIPFAIYLLSDNIFMLAVNGVFILLYSFVRFLDENDGKLKGYFPLMLKIAGLGVIGIALNAPRALNNFLIIFESPRVSGNVSQTQALISNPETIDNYLRNVTTTLRFFGNDLLGSGSEFRGWYNYLEAALFYVGLISLVLISSAFSFFNKKQRFFYGIFLGFWLLVAYEPTVRHAINFFAGNYFKNNVDIFVPFTILFLAMFAFEKIQSGKKTNPLIIVSTIGVLLIILHYPYFDFTNLMINFQMKLIISAFILLYGFIFFLLNSQKNKSFIKLIILLVVFVEISYISWHSVNNREIYTANELIGNKAGYADGTIKIINEIKQQDNSLFYRVEKDYFSGNSEHSSLNDAKAQGYFGTPSYGSFNQKYYIRFLEKSGVITKGKEGQTRWATGVRDIPLLMTFANVKYYLTKNPDNKILMNGYDSIGFQDNILIFKNKYYLPFGYSYNKYLPINDFEKLSIFKRQQALLSAIILEENSDNFGLKLLDTNKLVRVNNFNFDVYSAMIDSLRRDTFEIRSFINKKFDGEITLSEDKILFFTIPYDKGWRVYVDGQKADKILANTGFTGIYLTKGHHKIELKFYHLYIELTIIIAILTFLVLIILFYLHFKKKNA